MISLVARIALIAAIALVPALATARGGHGGGGPAGSGHSMAGHGGHDGDHDRDEAFGPRDDAANSGPCGMGWGWHEPSYCDEPSKEARSQPRPQQRAAMPQQLPQQQ
jgi:hypothetical protein